MKGALVVLHYVISFFTLVVLLVALKLPDFASSDPASGVVYYSVLPSRHLWLKSTLAA